MVLEHDWDPERELHVCELKIRLKPDDRALLVALARKLDLPPAVLARKFVRDGLVLYEAQIRRIISGMKCPYQFECCDPEVKGPAHIHCLGDSNLIECLDKRGRSCPFGVSFGYSIFCCCPLCKYLVEHDLCIHKPPI